MAAAWLSPLLLAGQVLSLSADDLLVQPVVEGALYAAHADPPVNVLAWRQGELPTWQSHTHNQGDDKWSAHGPLLMWFGMWRQKVQMQLSDAASVCVTTES